MVIQDDDRRHGEKGNVTQTVKAIGSLGFQRRESFLKLRQQFSNHGLQFDMGPFQEVHEVKTVF